MIGFCGFLRCQRSLNSVLPSCSIHLSVSHLWTHHKSSLALQQEEDLALSLVWRRLNPWPRNFHKLQVQPPQKKPEVWGEGGLMSQKQLQSFPSAMKVFTRKKGKQYPVNHVGRRSDSSSCLHFLQTCWLLLIFRWMLFLCPHGLPIHLPRWQLGVEV